MLIFYLPAILSGESKIRFWSLWLSIQPWNIKPHAAKSISKLWLPKLLCHVRGSISLYEMLTLAVVLKRSAVTLPQSKNRKHLLWTSTELRSVSSLCTFAISCSFFSWSFSLWKHRCSQVAKNDFCLGVGGGGKCL